MADPAADSPPASIPAKPPCAAVVGGGLAGLAAATALARNNWKVELFESRDRLGGRASSFLDKTTGELVDNCQHVSMGCCTNLDQFCRHLGLAGSFRREPTLHFIAPDGRRYDFCGAPWLPAPLHLAGGLWGLKFLSVRERIAIGRAMLALSRENPGSGQNMADWLAAHGQSPRAQEWFWGVVLVSALSETLERISVDYARKVFVEGFMAHPRAYEMEIPSVALGELYGTKMEAELARMGISLHLGQRVRRVTGDANKVTGLELSEGELASFDAVVVAVPWQRAGDLFDENLRQALPELAALEQLEPSPITSVHLWFDRVIAPVEHAVLVGRVGQWLFHRSEASEKGHYYQVVISASREASQLGRERLVETVCGELAAIWPAAREAKLQHSRTVTEHAAVFAPLPGVDDLRPAQKTAVPGLYLAGDWTRTGWPATMEGAVRSGLLAAEEVLRQAGKQQSLVAPDLETGWLARRL